MARDHSSSKDREYQNLNKPKNGIFQTFKQNFIYIVMFFSIVGAIYYNYTTQEVEGENEQDNTNPNKKISFRVIIASLVVIVTFIIFMVMNSKSFEESAKRPDPTAEKSYVNKLTTQQYNKITENTTKKELEKLFSDPKFKKMYEQKGNKPENWVWQTKEKEKKTVWRDREESDEDIDNLSQITISEDD
jgi:heme/copper-type cytochrome/quinol oxidase subunit 2